MGLTIIIGNYNLIIAKVNSNNPRLTPYRFINNAYMYITCKSNTQTYNKTKYNEPFDHGIQYSDASIKPFDKF